MLMTGGLDQRSESSSHAFAPPSTKVYRAPLPGLELQEEHFLEPQQVGSGLGPPHCDSGQSVPSLQAWILCLQNGSSQAAWER